MRLSILPRDKNWTRKKFPPVLFFVLEAPEDISLFGSFWRLTDF
jgi:hypothetical protein